MDTRQIKMNYDFYNTKIVEKKIALGQNEVLLEKLQKLNADLEEVSELRESLKEHSTSLKNIQLITVKEDDEFKKRRVGYLEDQITEQLVEIFPEENLKASINYDFKRGNSKAFLTLSDKKGNIRIPFISEGKLLQYLISFASTISTVIGLGASEIFIDEAFGVSSKENLPKIGQLIKSYADTGLQFVIISQSSDLYADIPRREIHFHKEPAVAGNELSGKVVLDEILDF